MGASSTRSWWERGTLRRPGPHLDRLPIGFDLSGVSFLEGLRAAVASGLLVLASVYFHSLPLLLAAFAANLTCFCDAGGPLHLRIRALLAYVGLGCAAWVGFGLLRNLPWPVAIVPAAAAIFLCSMARVWGAAAQAVGNVLIVTVALALDEPLGGHEAVVLGVSFVAGGLWAVLITMVIWRVHRTRAATRAVEEAWAALSALAADLRRLTLGEPGEAAWDAHARAYRRACRAALEDARLHVAAVTRAQGPASPTVRRAVIRLDAAETAFAALIALGESLEFGGADARAAGAQALRLLRPVMALWGKGVLGEVERFGPALQRVEDCGAGMPAIASPLHVLTDALRVMARASTTGEGGEPLASGHPPAAPVVEAAWRPLRENLAWDSAILRHAARATVLTVPAMIWSLVWWSPYSHWLTITVALTMQPYFAATWQRVLERVGGTLLGGLIGAAVAFLPQTGLVKAGLLVPLCVIGFSVRQVSYGAYIACLTPLVVVLFDVAVPGHSDTTIAAMRFTYTVGGGLLALGASVMLWPSWDSRRLRLEIGSTLAAYADMSDAIFDDILTPSGPGSEAARRAAGVASNNLEAALSRALQEPRRLRKRDVETGLVVDAALRRLGAALIALQHETDAARSPELSDWRRWLTTGLRDLAAGRETGKPPATLPAIGTLARLRRAVDVIATALAARTPVPARPSMQGREASVTGDLAGRLPTQRADR